MTRVGSSKLTGRKIFRTLNKKLLPYARWESLRKDDKIEGEI
jgi:hypothetical protein